MKMTNPSSISASNSTSENNNQGNEEVEQSACGARGVTRERQQELQPPIANIIRVMRKMLPPHAKISDGAKETIQQCVFQFIRHVTKEANNHCRVDLRKTVTAEDVLWAMAKLGFEDYPEPLAAYLNRYRQQLSERIAVVGEPSVVRRTMNFARPPPPVAPAAYASAFPIKHPQETLDPAVLSAYINSVGGPKGSSSAGQVGSSSADAAYSLLSFNAQAQFK